MKNIVMNIEVDNYKNNEPTKYDNWRFLNTTIWSDYWYDHERTLMVSTKTITVGKDTPKQVSCGIHGKLTINIGKVPVHKIFDIAITFRDELIATLHYHSTKEIDKLGHIPNLIKYSGSSSLYITLDMNYHVAITKNRFYTGGQFFSKIGGYAASFNAIWVYVAPFFVLYFLYNLANIIK